MSTAEETASSGNGWVGQAVKRKEDRPLITGRGNYVDNMQVPGMLWMAVVRSPVAHAAITSIDTSAAKARPGVTAVFTADDLAGGDIAESGIPMFWAPPGVEIKTPVHFPLARGEVKHAGQAVAVVIGADRYSVVDATEDVLVEYDERPVVVDAEAALADGAPLVHEDLGTNKTHDWSISGGDVDAALASAEVTVERRIVNHRISGAPIEPRSTIADPRGDELTVYSTTQIPHILAVRAVRDHRHPRGQAARRRPDRGRRLRGEAPGLRRGDPGRRDRAQARSPGEVDGVAHGAHGDVAPRPRPGQPRDDRGEPRRQDHRAQAAHDRGPGRVLPDPHAVHPGAGLPGRRTGATTSRTSSSTSPACSPTSSRPTRSAARAGRRSRTSSR